MINLIVFYKLSSTVKCMTTQYTLYTEIVPESLHPFVSVPFSGAPLRFFGFGIPCYTHVQDMGILTIARVRNPKNQLLQINPPTIVGCSL